MQNKTITGEIVAMRITGPSMRSYIFIYLKLFWRSKSFVKYSLNVELVKYVHTLTFTARMTTADSTDAVAVSDLLWQRRVPWQRCHSALGG